MKEYQDRHHKELVNPPLLGEQADDKTCKECGVPIKDADVDTCYECYAENFRRGN